MLTKTYENCVELNALCVTAKQAVDNCRLSLDVFLGKIRKFERSLGEEGSGSVVRDAARKVQWQMTKKDELAKFRAEVVGHCAAINMLVATAQVLLVKFLHQRVAD